MLQTRRQADLTAADGAHVVEGVTASRVAKSFGGHTVLHDIELAVRPGEFVCLLGPSGCGKTTLLRCIAGLERPDSGRIVIGATTVVDTARNVFVPPERRGLGMVFQHYALWPHMTVRQQIAYPLRKHGVKRAAQEGRIRDIMKVVGLPDLLDRRPSQLSGGQQQRVALARALVHEPPVLLLDEPLSNLDATLRGQLRRELRLLHERLGTTTILVTHDQEEAAALADVIAVMHQGRIVQLGTAASLFDRPRTRFVAEFVGFDNFIRGRVSMGRGHCARVGVGTGGIDMTLDGASPADGAEVMIAARSDALRLHPHDPGDTGMPALSGIISRMARIGRGIEFEVTLGDQVIIVRDLTSGGTSFELGAQVRVAVSGTPPVLVDWAGPQA